MKLISRSRFLPDVGVWGVPGTVAGVSPIGWKDTAVGRDATESIDHREVGCELDASQPPQVWSLTDVAASFTDPRTAPTVV